MKNLLLVVFVSFSQLVFAQEEFYPKAAAKWSPGALMFGNISLLGEYKLGNKSSLTAKLGIPAATNYDPTYDGDEARLKAEAFSFMAGYRMYLSRQAMKGFYFEPYFKYVNFKLDGRASAELDGDQVEMKLTNSYNGTGVGVQLGVQFLIAKRFTIDVYFFGPEINFADNEFKAVEISDSLPWSTAEAQEAEQDIRDFIDSFPFIRNKVDVRVDAASKTVTTSFNGMLPGYRGGVSFGFAF